MQGLGNENITETFTAEIFVGLKEGYDGEQHSIEELKDVLQTICNEGFCVSVIPCSYIYKDGREEGAKVTLINYPRFPSEPDVMKEKALDIATELKNHFKQYRVSIQTTDNTYMI